MKFIYTFLLSFFLIANFSNADIQTDKVAYILSHKSNEITPVDLKTGKALRVIPLEKTPKTLTLSPKGDKAYVIYDKSKEIIPIDLETNKCSFSFNLKSIPENLTISSDGKNAYYTTTENDFIYKLDLCTGESDHFLPWSDKISGIKLSDDNQKLFIISSNTEEIIPIELLSGNILSSITLPESAKLKTFIEDKHLAIVSNDKADEIQLYDLETGALDRVIELHSPDFIIDQLLIDPSGENAYLVNKDTKDVITLDLVTESITSAVRLEKNLDHMAIQFRQQEETPVDESQENETKALLKSKTQKKFSNSLLNILPLADFVTFDPGDTSTTLSSSALPSVFGQPVTLTASVTSLITPGVPTGTVNFINTNTSAVLGTGTLDASGNTSITLNNLAVGTYFIAANYLGDGTFHPSSSSPPTLEQDVNQALTTTALSSSLNPSFYGNLVTVTATVSVTSPGAGTPTGLVTFFDGSTQIGTASLTGNTASISSSSLTPGTHNITATYAGNTSFAGSTSPIWTQTVNKANTTTSLTSSANPSFFGNSVLFTATLTSGTASAGDTISFYDGATLLGTQTVTANQATLSTSTLALGTHSITAVYNGNSNYNASTSNAVAQVVNQGVTTTALTSSLNPSTFGASTTFTATVTLSPGQGAGSPTGTVTFRDGSTTLGTSPITSGVATLNVSNLSTGSHTITATYNGSTNFTTSVSSALTQVVNKATPTNVVTSTLNPSNYGDSVSFTATVTSPTTLGVPTGTITFFDGATQIGTGTLTTLNSTASSTIFITAALNAGTHSITAVYSGDTNFVGLTSPVLSQVVNPVPSTAITVFSQSPNPSNIGQPVVLKATATGAVTNPPQPPTGTITFFEGSTNLGTVTVSPVSGNANSATASLTISNFTLGTHAITAVYNGDVNYPASPVSAPLNRVVVQTSTKTVVATSGTPAVYGQNLTFTATITPVAPGAGAPLGTVSFYDGANLIGSGTLTAGSNLSTATFSTTALALGTHAITAVYNGNTDYTSSSSTPLTQVVNQDNTVTVITGSTSSPAGFAFGNTVTFTTTVSAAAPGSGTPTGTVSFYDGATLLGTSTLAGGTATFSTFRLYPGVHAITARYSGDTNFINSTSAVFNQTIVNTLPTTTTITSARNSSPGGASVTYSATVVAAPGPGQNIPGIPTGTVTFTDVTAGITIGTATLNASGVATITESGANLPFVGPAPDIHQIRAVYNGQAGVFVTSTSPLFDQYIVPLDTTTTLTATPNHTTQGGVTLTATVDVGGGVPPHPTDGTVTFYQGSLNLGTAPIDANGVATLNPDDLHFGLSTDVYAVYGGVATIGEQTQFAMSFSNHINLQVQQTDMLVTQTVISTSNANTIYCQPVTFTAVVTEIQGYYTPTGSVTFFDGDRSIGTALLDNTGTARLTVSSLSVQSTPHIISATYNSDSNYAFSKSNSINQNVATDNTTTTLALVPNLATTPYGGNIIIQATVTANGSSPSYVTVPDGTITFSIGSKKIDTVELDSKGMATIQISTLDVGSYTISAIYTPPKCCACFNPSSASLTHAISQINPDTTFVLTPNPVVYGTDLLLTATVTSTVGTPKGSVSFYNGTTLLGSSQLVDGTATLTITSPLAGFAVLRATYSGDTNFRSISANSDLEIISKATTATTILTFNTNPSVYGEQVTFGAQVTSPSDSADPGPTGTVTFRNGSTVLGTVALNTSLRAEIAVSNLPLGTGNNITATYNGDSNFLTSVSTPLNFVINQAETTTTVTSITSTPSPPTFGTPVTFNVRVAPRYPATGTPTGSITATYGSTVIGTFQLTNGVASFSTSILPVGAQTVLISYVGDTNFKSSQTIATQTVVGASTTTSVVSNANPSVFGQPVTFNATVTSSQGTPTGTISFLDGTTTLATATLNASGSASFTTSNLSVGTHTIRATYSGSANLATSTATVSGNQVVNKANTTTTLTSSLNPSSFGQGVTLTASVVANSPGAGIPTGTVTLRNGTTVIATGTINNLGQASLTITTALAASTTPYALSVTYNGDTNFNTSTGNLSQVINKVATSTSATYSPNPAPFGGTVTLNVQVTPINTGSGIPSGTVTANYGSQVVGTGVLSTNGAVTFQTTSLPAGTLGIVVNYLGDGPNGNFLPSSVTLTETVQTAVSNVTVTSSVNPSTVGQMISLTAQVSSTAGASAIPTGTVTFYDGVNPINTLGLNAAGVAILNVSNLTLGSHPITVSYSGDSNNAPALSTILTQVVNQASSSVRLNTILNPSVFGETVTLRAIVSAVNGGVPTGTITFKNGAATIGTATVSSNGEAFLNNATLPIGANSITAEYSGDTNYAAAVSTALTQTIARAPTEMNVNLPNSTAALGSAIPVTGSIVTLNNGSSNIPVGETVTAYYGANVVGSGIISATGTYNFTISGLPSGTSGVEIRYPGSTNFNASSVTLTQTVNNDAATITISSVATAPFGQSIAIANTVTLASGNTPTGTVNYYDGATLIGTRPANQPLNISTLQPGSHTITAVYSGSTNETSATSNSITIVITTASTTTTLNSNLNPSVLGQAVTLTANVSSATGTPTGFVTFMNGSSVIGTANVNTAGVATLTTTSIPVGSNNITAIYSGDADFATSTSTILNQVVTKATNASVAVVTGTPNPSFFGQNVNFFASVTAPSGTPTGTVSFFDGATLIGTSPILDGFAVIATNTLAVGNHNITAVYNGDANFQASAPSPIYLQTVNTVTITINTVTTLTSNHNPSNYGDPVTFDIAITSLATPPPYPTGVVSLYVGAEPLATLMLDSTGHTSYTTSSLPAGDLQIVALYSGDTNYSASTATIIQIVNPIITTTSVTSSANPASYGSPVTFTADVTSSVSPLPAGGTVSFFDGPTLLGTSTLNVSGVAAFTSSTLSTGLHNITATYNGSNNFASSSGNLSQQINKSNTMTMILSSSPNPSQVGENVNILANVVAPGGNPTGTVTFYDGLTPIGTAPLIGTIAILPTSSLTVGNHSITATYNGDSNFNPSTSTAANQQVINSLAILQSPRQLTGYQDREKFLDRKSLVNVIKWDAPGFGADATFYRIYRDASLTDLVAEIPACAKLEYKDYDRKKHVTYTYYIVAGNATSISPAAVLTIKPGQKKCH